jgi:hypothetical protein
MTNNSFSIKKCNGIAEVLLSQTCGSQPDYKKMPRQVKHALLKKLGEKHYNNIHDPNFYKKLEDIWTARKKLNEEDIIDRSKLDSMVECSICLETHAIDGKVTTLLCGHKFCSTCILTHIYARGTETCCPMCRSSLFYNNEVRTTWDDEEPHVHVSTPLTDEEVTERKRKKRRDERRAKRERDRNRK